MGFLGNLVGKPMSVNNEEEEERGWWNWGLAQVLELSAAMIVEIDFQGKEGKEIESEEGFWG